MTPVATVGLSERGMNLGYSTCSLMAMCYVLCRELGYSTFSLMAMCNVLCRELVLGFWGLEPETKLKWIHIEVVQLLSWPFVSTIGLSERGLNLGYFTCSLTAICYLLCRELVLGLWDLEPEINLKWMNIYWSYALPILDVRPNRRSVWGGSELTCFTAICCFL